MTTTRPGDDLAMRLNPFIGSTYAIRELCASLTRQGATYQRIQERWCNEEMTDETTARLEIKESAIEDRIRSLVAELPAPDDGPWSVTFQGDPRGRVVYLSTADGREITVA